MQILILLAIVHGFSSLVCADEQPVDDAPLKLAISCLLGASLVAFAWWIGQLRRLHVSTFRRLLRQAEHLHAGAFLCVTLITFSVLDVAQIVRGNLRLSGVILADELAVLLILSLPLFVSWGFLVETVSVSFLGRERWREVFFQARFLLLLPIVPILLLSGFADIQRLMMPETSTSLRSCLGGIACLLVIFSVPWLFRFVWPTYRLQNENLKRLLTQPFLDAGITIRGIFVWKTSGRVVNAAVAGLIPGRRYLFVTDALIQQLAADELEAIAAHEAAHFRFRHLRRLAMSLAIPMLLLAVFGGPSDVNSDWNAPLLAVCVLGIWAGLHGRWARQLEHEADLGACRWLSGFERGRVEPSSVEQYVQALTATGANPDGDWLHPPAAERIVKLAQWAADPHKAIRFQTQLNRFCRLQTLVILILIATLVLTS